MLSLSRNPHQNGAPCLSDTQVSVFCLHSWEHSIWPAQRSADNTEKCCHNHRIFLSWRTRPGWVDLCSTTIDQVIDWYFQNIVPKKSKITTCHKFSQLVMLISGHCGPVCHCWPICHCGPVCHCIKRGSKYVLKAYRKCSSWTKGHVSMHKRFE